MEIEGKGGGTCRKNRVREEGLGQGEGLIRERSTNRLLLYSGGV